MIYLIDGRIKYRTEDGAVWLANDESTAVVLTVTMNRLLSFLIERRGAVISRDDIFENVWDAHGLRSSNNTLTKYISELRKILSGFGVAEGGISTVPRIGLMLSNGLDVQVDENAIITQSIDNNNISTQLSHAKYNSRSIIYILMSALGITTLATVIAAFLYSPAPMQKKLSREVTTQLLLTHNSCPVYTTHKNSLALSPQKINIFNEIISSKKIDCLPGAIFLFQPSDAIIYGHKGRVFLSRCTMNKELKKDFASCLSIYWSDYAPR